MRHWERLRADAVHLEYQTMEVLGEILLENEGTSWPDKCYGTIRSTLLPTNRN